MDESVPIIVLAFANDRDDRVRYLRALSEEARRLRQALEPAERAGLCRVILRQNAALDDILDVFQQPDCRNRIAVLHFGGHAASFKLLFEAPDGRPHAASAAGLAAFLAQQTGLQLVFLNGCSTQPQAQGLLDAGVAAVIATAQAIDDAVATEFSARFYRGLAGGAGLVASFREAESALRAAHGDNPRALYPAGQVSEATTDRWPWELTVRPGAESAEGWNLPDAAGTPLFGLPPLPQTDLPDSPYRYLDWYRREDAELFFGRGRQIRDLLERLTGMHAAPIVLFYGQAGVGKSSLLAAGVLPRLEAAHAVRYVRRDQAAGLLGTLRAALGGGDEIGPAWRAAEEREGRPLVVILDQVEEACTRPNPGLPDELAAFLAELRALLVDVARRPRGRLLLAFRKEWLAEVEAALQAQDLPRTKFFLERLDRRGIVEVVTGPASSARLRQQYGLTVADGLSGLIADDLLADAGSAVAPTLQILLAKMWEHARHRNHDHPTFDRPLYDELRAQGLGLGDFLDQQLGALRAAQPEVVASGLALDLLAHHTTPLGTAEQRALADLEVAYRHRPEDLSGLVQGCQDRFLLVDPARSEPGRPRVSRLAHDTLAPLVRQRFDESDQPGQRARRILESRAADWDGSEGAPLDDADLAAVEGGSAGMRAWRAAEERLVEASRAARDRRRRSRRIWQAVGLLAILAILLASAVATWQWQTAEGRRAEAENARSTAQAEAENALQARATAEARRLEAEDARASAETERAIAEAERATAEAQRNSALSRQVVVLATPLRDKDAALSLLLNAQATRFDGNPEARRGLLAALESTSDLRIATFGHANGVGRMAFSPDGRWLATGGRTVRLWDLRDLDAGAIDLEHAWILGLAFSPDGRWLATAGDGTVSLWDLTSPAAARVVLHISDQTRAVAFSLDGSRLATAGSQNPATAEGPDVTTWVWDVTTGGIVAELESHEELVTAVALSPNGRWLATAGLDDTAWLWDLDTGEVKYLQGGRPGERVLYLAFRPDGASLAMVHSNGTIDLYSISTGESLGEPVRLWDVTTGGMLGESRFSSWLYGIAFSPIDQTIATGGWPEVVVRLWDPVTGRLLGHLRGHQDAVGGAAFSPDGRLLATGSGDGQIILWEVGLDLWQARACRLAGRNLSLDEWNQYVGADVPYRCTCPDLSPGEDAPPDACESGLPGARTPRDQRPLAGALGALFAD